MVRDEMTRLADAGQWHDDLRPWNFVLDGRRAHAIDVRSKPWRTEPEPGALDKCLDMMRTRSAA